MWATVTSSFFNIRQLFDVQSSTEGVAAYPPVEEDPLEIFDSQSEGDTGFLEHRCKHDGLIPSLTAVDGTDALLTFYQTLAPPHVRVIRRDHPERRPGEADEEYKLREKLFEYAKVHPLTPPSYFYDLEIDDVLLVPVTQSSSTFSSISDLVDIKDESSSECEVDNIVASNFRDNNNDNLLEDKLSQSCVHLHRTQALHNVCPELKKATILVSSKEGTTSERCKSYPDLCSPSTHSSILLEPASPKSNSKPVINPPSVKIYKSKTFGKELHRHASTSGNIGLRTQDQDHELTNHFISTSPKDLPLQTTSITQIAKSSVVSIPNSRDPQQLDCNSNHPINNYDHIIFHSPK